MYVDRLVKEEGAGVWGVEAICLATRPHWFSVVEQGAGLNWAKPKNLLLMAGGAALLLFGQPVLGLQPNSGPLLADWITLFQAPGIASGPADGTGASVPPLNLPQIIDISIIWGGVVLALAGALVLGWALLKRHFTEYAITLSPGYSGRIIKVQGVLTRKTVAVPLGMVNNLELYEPLAGRLFGWGDIEIETGNDYEGDRLEHVPDPRGFYQMWKLMLDLGFVRSGVASGVGSPARSRADH